MAHSDAPVVPEEVPNAFDLWSEAPPVAVSIETADNPANPELSEEDNLGLETYQRGSVSGPPRNNVTWSGSLESIDTPPASVKKPRGKKAKKEAKALRKKLRKKGELECVPLETASEPSKSDLAIGRKKQEAKSKRSKAIKSVYKNKDKEISVNLKASRKDKKETGRETRVKEVRAIKVTDVTSNVAEITKTHAKKKLEKKKLKTRITNSDGTLKSTRNSWRNVNQQIPGKSYTKYWLVRDAYLYGDR